MPVLKKKVTSDFTVVHNTFIRDNKLGIAARGLLLTMLSMHEDWNFSVKGLAAILPDGSTKVSTALKELEKYGYLKREHIYENGKICDWIYIFSDEPIANTEEGNADIDNDHQQSENLELENLNLGSQDVDSKDVGFVDVENPHDNQILYKSNNNKSNTDVLNINPINQTSGECSVTIREAANMSDGIDKIDLDNAKAVAKEQIDAEVISHKPFYHDENLVNELVELIAWVNCTSQPYLKINGVNLDIALIREQFEKLNGNHACYVLDCLKETDVEIKNRRNYLLTCLFNAPATMEGYYQNRSYG